MRRGSAARVVHLCFHGIGRPARDLEDGEEPYWITADTYQRVLDEVAGDPRVRLSFDDGNASDLEIGLPALVERGLTATFYVLAARLDRPGSLARGDVRELSRAGMTIGSHGMDHRPWRGLLPAGVRRELVEARAILAEAAGQQVDRAALPLGRYDRRTLGHLRRLGYASVASSDRRWSTDSAWLQPRFSVRSHDTPHSVRREMLTPQPLGQRVRLEAVGLAKRLR
ncbi:polysaccharide deacetylase family protein [Nocardioides sp. zg-1228]|uniref:polysaccharide deacetylase family protein n=1 Tax=Nocardioides sp. zg-1228 TaxID=2763008 RepID=UPI001642FDB9|nr:polysaccharide deacetylase family protein [Nocardioides sp. zg-1228]MBC2931413.1 polysaccharide deacetylase family protein [Nocardioides sp. zg-1228]QSF57029.1 polysaccharide deacetylase family protein [Nocardioides sp. zg-1228]